jgi:sugar lactone lactonase YvrE
LVKKRKNDNERKKQMKTITRFVYSVFAVLTLTVGTLTVDGAVNDLFISVDGSGDNGGGFIYKYAPNGAQSIFAAGLSRPRGVAFDRFGNLFVATTTSVSGNLAGAILKITPDGTQTTFVNVMGPSISFFLEDLAFDRAGNLFVMAQDETDPDVASTIYKFAPNGVQSTFGSVPSEGFGLAFDSAGNLFAASDATDRTIYKFTPNGTRSVFVGPSAFGTLTPVGLAFDHLDNLFVSATAACPDPASILKFTPDGTGSTFVTGLVFPNGLAFGRGGTLFSTELFCNGAGSDVLKFTTGGTRHLFAIVPGQNNGNPKYLAFQFAPTPHSRP